MPAVIVGSGMFLPPQGDDGGLKPTLWPGYSDFGRLACTVAVQVDLTKGWASQPLGNLGGNLGGTLARPSTEPFVENR